MGARLGLRVVHLDPLYWRPGWQTPHPGDFLARVAEAVAGDTWISEGNYRETFALRMPRADMVVILDSPRWLCLWRVLRRSTLERGNRPDLPDDCPEHTDWELLKFIWRFKRVTWPRIDAARMEHGSGVPTVRLRGKRAIRDFLATLLRSPPSPGP